MAIFFFAACITHLLCLSAENADDCATNISSCQLDDALRRELILGGDSTVHFVQKKAAQRKLAFQSKETSAPKRTSLGERGMCRTDDDCCLEDADSYCPMFCKEGTGMDKHGATGWAMESRCARKWTGFCREDKQCKHQRAGGDDVSPGSNSICLRQHGALVGTCRDDTLRRSGQASKEPQASWESCADPVFAAGVLCTCLTPLMLLVYLLKDESTILGAPLTKYSGASRSALLDNAKFILVALVILHHSTNVVPRIEPWYSMGLQAINSFDSAALCFSSGIVSRTAIKVENFLLLLVCPLISACFIIEPISEVAWQQTDLQLSKWSPLSGYWAITHLWYLWALVWWRLWGRALSHFTPILRMLVSCGITSLACYYITPIFCLSSAFRYLPIFVAGQVFPFEEALVKLPCNYMTSLIGVALLLAIAFCQFYFAEFAGIHEQPEEGKGGHLAFLSLMAFDALMVLKSVIFLCFVCPRERTFMSDLGKHSLYAYVLHPHIMIPLLQRAVTSMPLLENTSSLSLPVKLGVAVAQVVLCFVACALLATYPVRCVFSLMLEPTYLKKLWAKDIPAQSAKEQDSEEISKKQSGTGVPGAEVPN